MARRPIEEFNVRTIQKTGGDSYIVTIPVNLIRKLGWQKGQKVVLTEYGDSIRIRDWKSDEEQGGS